jgi:hypothetical protein
VHVCVRACVCVCVGGGAHIGGQGGGRILVVKGGGRILVVMCCNMSTCMYTFDIWETCGDIPDSTSLWVTIQVC